MTKEKTLYYADCLEVLRQMDGDTIDTVYLDPPFNSKAQYNVLFGVDEDSKQREAFRDLWQWSPVAEERVDQLCRLCEQAEPVARYFRGTEIALGRTGMLAYVSFLAERCIEIRRVLKPTGWMFLHCDDTASHYIKTMLDAVFGAAQYRNHLIWRRATAHSDSQRFGRICDHILAYGRGPDSHWFGERIATPRTAEGEKARYPHEDERGRYASDNLTGPGTSDGESGRAWRGYDVTGKGRCWSAPKTGAYAKWIEEHHIPGYRAIKGVHARLDKLDEEGFIHHPKTERGYWPGLKRYAEADAGLMPQNLILEPMGFTNYSTGGEYLKYDTQKPTALIEPLLEATTPEDGRVMDPFCGCGTLCEAATNLGLEWVGCDISIHATDITFARLRARYGEKETEGSVERKGAPGTFEGAKELALRSLRAAAGIEEGINDVEAAEAMALRSAEVGEKHGRNAGRFEFQRWVVGLLDGIPEDREIGDEGRDGLVYFQPRTEHDKALQGVVQVKSGKYLARDLQALAGQLNGKVKCAILVMLRKPNETQGMCNLIKRKGRWKPWEGLAKDYPRLQVWSVEEHFKGIEPEMPARLNPVHVMERERGRRQQQLALCS